MCTKSQVLEGHLEGTWRGTDSASREMATSKTVRAARSQCQVLLFPWDFSVGSEVEMRSHVGQKG